METVISEEGKKKLLETPSRLFYFLCEGFKKGKEEALITNMREYTVMELAIPLHKGLTTTKISAWAGFTRIGSGCIVSIWLRKPMGTRNDDEVNVFDPKPICEVESADWVDEGVKSELICNIRGNFQEEKNDYTKVIRILEILNHFLM